MLRAVNVVGVKYKLPQKGLVTGGVPQGSIHYSF